MRLSCYGSTQATRTRSAGCGSGSGRGCCGLFGLRMDHRLQGRIDASDVLQEAFVDFAGRVDDYLRQPDMPFYLWLRFLTSQHFQLLHRHHLGAGRFADARREVSLHRGAMPRTSSVSLAAQLLGRFTSVSDAVHRAEMQLILQEVINGMDPIDREIVALRHFEEPLQRRDSPGAGHHADRPPARVTYRALQRLRQVLKKTPGFFDKRRD